MLEILGAPAGGGTDVRVKEETLGKTRKNNGLRTQKQTPGDGSTGSGHLGDFGFVRGAAGKKPGKNKRPVEPLTPSVCATYRWHGRDIPIY